MTTVCSKLLDLKVTDLRFVNTFCLIRSLENRILCAVGTNGFTVGLCMNHFLLIMKTGSIIGIYSFKI